MRLLPENVTAYLVDIDYSGHKKVAHLTFYEPKSKRLYDWFATELGHKPYCLTNLSPFELEKIRHLINNSFERFEVIEKYDALNDRNISVTKIIATDPKTIGGGRPQDNIRDIIPNNIDGAKVWEAKIDYGSCFMYDELLEMGMPYYISSGKLIPVDDKIVERKISNILDEIDPYNREDRWVKLFEYPVPYFLRVALDIEVLGKSRTRVPDSNKAEYPVISACLVGSDGKRRVLLLLRKGIEVGEEIVDADIEFFDNELDLIEEIFRGITNYPVVITFNGDNFDLTYLYNRAINLGIRIDNIPIHIRRKKVQIQNSIHIDLYRLFFNRSLKNYAFQGKYKVVSLDAIGNALLGEGKLHTDEDIWLATEMRNWSYSQLAKYNLKDGIVTLDLTTYDDDLVMKLIVALMRISTLSMEDLIRYPISSWIRGMIFYEHRKKNYLIPNTSDIKSFPHKWEISTKAIIKGKKYKGAIVVEPLTGIHFNVAVMDFASLYPSILKTKNLGYSTVNCNHEGCKSNIVPETTHWICKKNISIEGKLIGSLKDLRVNWYKKKRKESSWYSVVEQAIKVICNASYGVFGDDSFCLYCPPVSESITAFGRHSITRTIDKARNMGIEILYGDTDSIFLKNPTKEQTNALIGWSTKELGLDLEVDKEYRYVCLSQRKKNYLGVTPDGKVDVKGMSGKKKHIPRIVKNAFNVSKKYLSQAKSLDEILACKKALKKVIKDIYYRIKRRDFELNEIVFMMTLGKDPHNYDKTIPQHARAALMLEKELGITLKKGDSISFVKCIPFDWRFNDGEKLEKVNVKPLQLAKKENVDINKYHEILKSTFEQLLDALDVDYDTIIGLTKLENFM